MSLTDDWKAGKLKMGWYYVRFNCYKNPMPTYYSKKYNEFSNDGNVVEVLDEVPSYEEFKLLKSLVENGQSAIDTNQRLAKELKRLKDENDELKNFDGENVCLENEVLELKVERLRGLLKEATECMKKAERNYGYDDTIVDIFSDIYKRIIISIGESEE